mgnify:CR=1 FL=1
MKRINNKVKQIPTFKTIEEERKFWDTHSVVDYWEMLRPAKVKFPKPKHLLLTLKPSQFDSLRKLSLRKHTSFPQLIQTWITERLQEESAAIAR